MTDRIAAMQDFKLYRELHWEGSFEDYLAIVREKPQVTRNAYQRLYDMIISYGTEEYIDNKKKLIRYNFFKDEQNGGANAIFGLDIPLMRLVHVLKAAAEGYGPEKRVILLHGPVGSSKSTIARLLKQGVEQYSRSPDGALYTFEWVGLAGTGIDNRATSDRFPSPMNEEPLRIIPPEWRAKAIERAGALERQVQGARRRRHGPGEPLHLQGPHAEVRGRLGQDGRRSTCACRRLVLSEKDRVGIGTFQPKDEKNQDSTELTGDINYRKIAEYGSDSDPRAFNFDGEFNIANRGVLEFIEILKLDVAFLYDLLGATQEHKIKPKKFAQTDIDEVIIGHTNEAEYKKLLNNEFMEALRDRTIKIDIPYITKLTEEIRIYEKDFNGHEDQGQAHRAAHARSRRDVGRAHAPRGPEEAQPVAPAEDEALRRQGAARVHAGHRQGAPQGVASARGWRASRRATCRTRSRTRSSTRAARAPSTRSWC